MWRYFSTQRFRDTSYIEACCDGSWIFVWLFASGKSAGQDQGAGWALPQQTLVAQYGLEGQFEI